MNTNQALGLVEKLEIVDYQHIPEYQSGTRGRGVLAQEVKKILPNAVSTFPEMKLNDGSAITDFLSVDYHWLYSTGIAAIQELKKQIDQLRQKIDEM